MLIKKGHCIRVDIAGADKDTFARYPFDDESIPIIRAERNKKFASKIVLPMKE